MRHCKKCGKAMKIYPIRKTCEECQRKLIRTAQKKYMEKNKRFSRIYILKCSLGRLQKRISAFEEKYPDYEVRKTRRMYDHIVDIADSIAKELNKLTNVL